LLKSRNKVFQSFLFLKLVLINIWLIIFYYLHFSLKLFFYLCNFFRSSSPSTCSPKFVVGLHPPVLLHSSLEIRTNLKSIPSRQNRYFNLLLLLFILKKTLFWNILRIVFNKLIFIFFK
jgi:hypothetical protein